MPKATDSSTEDKIVELYLGGASYEAIVRTADCAMGTINRVLSRRGVARNRSRKIPTNQYGEIMLTLASGMTIAQTAKKFDVCDENIAAVKARCGAVVPRLTKDSRKRMCLEDRMEIMVGIRLGETDAEIARRIGFHRSSVGKEVERNGGRESYQPSRAHQRACDSYCRPKEAKLITYPDVRAFVEGKLEDENYWSPEQVAAAIRKQFPDERDKWVSFQTIYESLYVQARGALKVDVKRCLRSSRSQRKARTQTAGKGRIVDMINIAKRPPEADDRRVPGHWEGDLIVGELGQSAILTLVERTSRFVMLIKVEDKTTIEVTSAMANKITQLPEQLLKTITWDQGKEMAAHKDFSVATNIDVYFCDPHSPWQRGSNENTNGLLRQYFPKGSDLSEHSQERLDYVAMKLNTRPRKTLGFVTPSEKFNELVALTA